MKSDEQIQEVLKDLAHWAKVAQTDVRKALEESDPWLQFPHPSGSGHMLSGDQTRAAVLALSRFALSADDLEHRVHLPDAMKKLMSGLCERFVKNRSEVTRRNGDRLLAWVTKWARGQIADWEFYFPIRFIHQTDDVLIKMGDVAYRPLTHALTEKRTIIRDYFRESTQEAQAKWTRRQVREAFNYYKNYKWLALVSVHGFDRKTAETVAEEALKSSMDCCHVAFGRQATDRLRAANFNVAHDRRARAFRKKHGTLEIWTSVGSLDGMRLPDDWADWLNAPDQQIILGLSGLALQAITRGERRRSLAVRFLDAARWYGEGVRDETSFGKVVKFVTALERALAAGTSQDITKMICSRTANLLYTRGEADWKEIYQRASNAYDLRSRLVHGSISPFDDKVAEGVRDIGDLTEELLGMLLFRLNSRGLLEHSVSEAAYAKWHEDVDLFISNQRNASADESASP